MRGSVSTFLACIALGFFAVPARADRILIVGGDASTDSLLSSYLTLAGDQVTVGPSVNNFIGAGLSNYNAVVLAPSLLDRAYPAGGAPVLTGDMPLAGQQALVGYVASGGGLVTGGNTLTNYLDGGFQTLYKALPFMPNAIATSNTSISFGMTTPNPALDAHLPSNFSFTVARSDYNTEEYYQPKPGAISYFSTNQWSPTFGGYTPSSGALGWSYGSGKVFSISSPIDSSTLSTAAFGQLVSNAVSWSAGHATSGSALPPVWGANPPIDPPPIPEPATILMWSAVAGGLAISTWRRRQVLKTV